MSRGFVKEDDQEEIPFVSPRADLPQGVTNYVTQLGYNALLEEKKQLINERSTLTISSEKELRITTNTINAKLVQLETRISTAKVIVVSNQYKNEVRFGAVVALKNLKTNTLQTFQIVGVDEANIDQEKISFVSPLAKKIINRKVGEQIELELPTTKSLLEIISIKY
ncbi:Transcription elongation factor GreA [Kordia antarctica]|uniref:Transcription elongation factor GreA n=1 Tax=Kordia antarctica TaxID=1218801 RepID=A0A7L4ZRG1_9FLAO|nr:GreA/GreB family elongation factor [Kordia antarctica]QHI39288.1 Transcription elongation factor GreA [Kordia antarctica]